jgi:DNA-binding NtrC family response regulator
MFEKDVMIVEDDSELVRILQVVIKKLNVKTRLATTGRKALQLLQDASPAVLLLDMRLPDMMGSEILNYVQQRALPITVIVMTAHGSVDIAVDAMRHGAYDFLTKPLDFERVQIMVRNAMERHELIQQLEDFRSDYERARFHQLRGSAPMMQRLYQQLGKCAGSSSPLLVQGDTGTELDLVARSLHEESPRSSQSFKELDLAKIPSEEQYKMIFGSSTEPGLITSCKEGTLFLKNLELATAKVQEGLFDFLRDGEIEPVDGQPQEVNTRLVAGCYIDLKKKMENREFDEDLYYAISVNTVHLVPLKDRGEDIYDLAESLIKTSSMGLDCEIKSMDDSAIAALFSYDWPGNCQELSQVIEQIMEQNKAEKVITDKMFPQEIQNSTRKMTDETLEALRGLEVATTIDPLWQIEKETIERALKLCNENIIHAARALEITPATIYRKQRAWKARSS